MSTMEMAVNTRAAVAARMRRRRRREMLDTLAEAAVTIGLGISFIACSVLMICAR